MFRAVRIAVEAWWVYWSHETGLPFATKIAVSTHSQALDLFRIENITGQADKGQEQQ